MFLCDVMICCVMFCYVMLHCDMLFCFVVLCCYVIASVMLGDAMHVVMLCDVMLPPPHSVCAKDTSEMIQTEQTVSVLCSLCRAEHISQSFLMFWLQDRENKHC